VETAHTPVSRRFITTTANITLIIITTIIAIVITIIGIYL
jgi:hypothetical protein